MERTGTRPAHGVDDQDLVELVERPGPFTSIYLPLERASENAAQRNELRWRDLRATIETTAPGAALDAVPGPIEHIHHVADAVGVICAGDEVALVHPVDASPAPEGFAAVGALPRLAPIIATRHREVPYVVALVDRRGADLTAVGRHNRVLDEEMVLDDDRDRPDHKPGPGGWSQPR